MHGGFAIGSRQSGVTVGVAVALKFFLWPLVFWLAALRRWRDATVAAVLAAATLLLLIPFISIAEYARLLRRLGATFDQDSFTIFGLLVQAGSPERLARVVALALAIAVLAIAWRRQSFVLFVAAALMLSPIVWLDYYALLAIPLAVVQPRLSAVWLLPILTFGITSGGAGAGHVSTTIWVLMIFALVTVLAARREGERVQSDSTGHGHAAFAGPRPSSGEGEARDPARPRHPRGQLAPRARLLRDRSAPLCRVRAGHRRRRHVASLVSGREIIDHGLPHVDHLTVYGGGKTWTDQQWLAHLVLYGSERLGGFGLVTLVGGVSVLLAYGISLVVVRARGATTRATLLVFIVVLFAAPWTWTVRAQVLVLPLFAAVVALAVDARDGLRRRSWLAIPILLLWGNLHGSAFLGALIVSAVGVLELVRRRRPLLAAAFAVAPWLALLVTPYGPVATVRYYRLLLVDPPFADVVSEWDRPGIEWATIAFGILLIGAVILLVTGWRRFALTEVVVLALTAAVALQAIRGSTGSRSPA